MEKKFFTESTLPKLAVESRALRGSLTLKQILRHLNVKKSDLNPAVTLLSLLTGELGEPTIKTEKKLGWQLGIYTIGFFTMHNIERASFRQAYVPSATLEEVEEKVIQARLF